MDPMMILTVIGLITKGVSVAKMLIEAGKDAMPAIKVIKDLVTGAESGKITDEELAANEATLDAMIDEFNEPIAD